MRIEGGCQGGEVHEPALKDWSQLENLQVQRWDLNAVTANLRKAYADNPKSQNVRGGGKVWRIGGGVNL